MWDGCSDSDSNLLEDLQIECARFVIDAMKGSNRVCLLRDASWAELSDRLKMHKRISYPPVIYVIVVLLL